MAEEAFLKRKLSFLLLVLAMNISLTVVGVMFFPSPSGNVTLGEGYLFTFAHITDSHLPKSAHTNGRVFEWLANESNVSFVVHTGDVVDDALDESAWEEAHRYFHQLGNRCSWAVLAGNHDVVSWKGVNLADYERHSGSSSTNQHVVVEDRLLFILLSWDDIEGAISEERLEWMDSVIQNHSDMLVVVCLHPHLFGLSLLNVLGAPNYDQIWRHMDNHDNVVMTLCGHIHRNWVQIHSTGRREIWSISTEALMDRGYIRLFDVYQDRIEVYAYSPFTDQAYANPLDRFTIDLNPDSHDADKDLWGNNLDYMPTHPLVPNGIIASVALAVGLVAYWKSSHDVKASPRSADDGIER